MSVINIGIDLGTVNLLVYVQGKGVIFDEPSVIAYNVENGEVVAFGKKANEMSGLVQSNIKVIRPLRGGVISNLKATRDLLKSVLSSINLGIDNTSNCIICCPSEVTMIEKSALKEVCNMMGLNNVAVEEEVVAALLGSGYEIDDENAKLIVDIGGGTTDIGIVFRRYIDKSLSSKQAGNYIDHEISRVCSQKFDLEVGMKTIENIKFQLATTDQNYKNSINITGRDKKTGLAKEQTVKSDDFIEIFVSLADEVCKLISQLFSLTSPGMCADIASGEIVLSGGGALIDGLGVYIQNKIGIPVVISNEPLKSVALGTNKLF